MDVIAVTWTLLAGVLAGFIDSLAGGGGLITIPSLALIVGPGVVAVGTNKVAGLAGALTAFLVYRRGGHFAPRPALVFASWVGLGSITGSLVAARIPASWFPWMLLVSCPVILLVALRKDLWVRSAHVHRTDEELRGVRFTEPAFLIGGTLCGFYDGAWGPGAGTFMFLALFFACRLTLLQALTVSKLCNTVSAGTALVSFGVQGHVRWIPAVTLAAGMIVGASVGSRYASRDAAKVVRPALVIVTILLLLKVLKSG